MQSVKRPVAAARSNAPVIPGYRLIAQLGSGGEGDVWMGERVSCKTRVALKIHRATHTQDAQGIERVRRGFRVLKALNCQGIARAIEEGETPSGELWLSTTLIEGRTLLEHVNQLDQSARQAHGANRRWSFPTAVVLDVFQKVCECVQLAHRVGILHRDLKPSNVIVDSQGQPWLVDFGLARECIPAASPPVTIPGQFVGSVEYASPEQIDGSADQIDQRSDLYSLGVMLYQFLTGAFPYDVRGPLPKVFDRIRFEKPAPPRKLAPWIDRDLQAIVLKALEKRPDDRYATVEEFRDDLRRYVNGEPARARQGGSAAAFARFVTRHRGLAVTVAIVAAMTIGYAVSVTAMYRRARFAEARALINAEDARRRFSAARQLAEYMVTELDRELSQTMGAAEIRIRLLESAFEHLQDLTIDDSNDPRLMADLASVYGKRADVAESIGRFDDAAAAAARVLEIRQRLANLEPDNADLQADLSIAIVRVGDISAAQGNREVCMRCYERAYEIDDSIAARFPFHPRYLSNLSWSCNRLSALLRPSENTGRAAELVRRRYEITKRLADIDPANLEWKYDLISCLREQAYNDPTTGVAVSPHARLPRLREAMLTADGLRNARPTNTRFLQAWFITRACLIDSLAEAGDLHEAEALAWEMSGIVDAAVTGEPAHLDWMKHYIGLRLKLALFAQSRGDLDAARTLFLESFARLQRTSSTDPTAFCELWDKSIKCIGRWEASDAHSELACSWYQEYMQHVRYMLAVGRNSPTILTQLVNLLLDCPCVELRNPHEARALAQLACTATPAPSPEALLALARAQLALCDTDQASQTAESAIRLLPEGEALLRNELDRIRTAAADAPN